ncbi:MAG: alkaline phosphatase family protein [Actinomycetota bacterium]
MIRRLRPLVLTGFASIVVATGVFADGPSSGAAESDAALAKRVCSAVDEELLIRVRDGVSLERSGQIQFVADEPNFVDGGLTHAGPWDYVQDVPLFLYGPGSIKPGTYTQRTTLADIAPTQAELLDFPDFHAPDGHALSGALEPKAKRQSPKLVVTLVWDSAGMDVLDTWPRSWPYLKSIQRDGAWFTNAIAGASPSNTPVSHATMGTGALPWKHGFTDEFIYMNGKLQKPNENGPGFLMEPTFADLYDASLDNAPIVGVIATLSAHVMMMSHGNMWGGGDKDLAITREKEDAETGGAESVTWGMTSDMGPFYRLPGYANELPGIDRFNDELDREDGKIDGKWRQNDIAQLVNGFDTPARTPYQTQLVKEVIAQEGFGADDTPDLLFLNYKAIDTIGHRFSANGIEMSDAVRYQDDDLKELIGYLNREVGAKQWVMILTADHGTNRDPEITGAFQIAIDELQARIEERFDDDDGVPLVLKLRPTQIWLDDAELKQSGSTVDEVADFIDGLTQAETVKPTLAPAPKPDERVFSAAFPSRILLGLPCLRDTRGGELQGD